MNVLQTYILHKAFHAVAVRPFQTALPALRLRVKNSELANDRVNIKKYAPVGFVIVSSLLRPLADYTVMLLDSCVLFTNKINKYVLQYLIFINIWFFIFLFPFQGREVTIYSERGFYGSK